MKKLLLTIVFSLSLFLGQNAVSAFDVSDISAVGVIGVIEGGEYTNDLSITITGGTATLNGEPYNSGTVINEIGYHTLVLYELDVEVDTISFTILPRFTINMEDVVVFDTLYIQLENEGVIEINHSPIENNTTYQQIGNHTLTVFGVNDYEITYNLSIKDSLMEYLRDNPMYSDFTIDVSKYVAVYYENVKQVEDITFTEIGYYNVKLLYKDGTIETVDFTYAHATSRFVDGGVYPNSLLLQKDSAVSWHINNSEQRSILNSTFLKIIGKHTITYKGNNGYEKKYYITITEGDIGLHDGMVFDDYFKLEYSGFKLTLNGTNYKSNYEKNGGGYYTVTIKGVNGYENFFDIFINEEVPFEAMSASEDPQVITESMTLDQQFRKIYVNGKKVENFRFRESGEYRVVYLGAGGYLDAYTIVYENEHQDVNELLFLGVIGLSSLVGITYLFLAWRRFK